MASLRKLKNKRYLAEVRKQGQYKSKTFDNKVQAMAWIANIVPQLSQEGVVKGKTLGDTLTCYRDEVPPTKKSYKNEYNRLNKFLRSSLSSVTLIELKQHHFDEWIVSSLKKIEPSSVNRDLNLFSAVFEQAIRWNWTTTNPIRGIRRPKNPQPRDRRISDKEIERILDTLAFDGQTVTTTRHIIAVAFLFAIETAMRQGEIWGLTWDDVFLDKRFVRLQETKNGAKRDVPLSNEAIRLLGLLSTSHHGKVFNSNQASSGTIFRRCLAMGRHQGAYFP